MSIQPRAREDVPRAAVIRALSQNHSRVVSGQSRAATLVWLAGRSPISRARSAAGSAATTLVR